MQNKQKPVTQCVSEKDNLIKIEGLPRDTDNFWRTDLTLSPSLMSGKKCLRYRRYSKGLSFSHRERQLLNIHGLLPHAVLTMEQQVMAHQKYFATLTSQMAKYIFLTDLEARNRTLFYSFLMSNPDEYMKVFVSATTGYLVKQFGIFYTVFRGMFITIKDRGHIYDVLSNWPYAEYVRCLIVSNGKSVLSWGDQGVNGTPVIVYKKYSNVVHGGIEPDCCLPVTLDVGTDNEQLLQNPQYCGIRQKRISAAEFDEFFEEFTHAVIRLFGSRAIIQTKDFGSSESIKQLSLYRKQQCIVDIDLQYMGACGLAGILGALQITKLQFKDNVLLFHGDSSFCIGMARMCVAYLKRSGLNESAAKSGIWFYDGKGLVVFNRTSWKVSERMQEFQHVHEPVEGLVESIDAVKPNILIGFRLGEKAFTKDVLRAMERSAQHPIIFAMSRPLEVMECTAEDAYTYTKGRCIYISGISLPSIKYANKVYQPGYCSSDYIISGLTLGVMLSGMTAVPDETFLVAAERLASLIWPTDLVKRDVYAPHRKLRSINLRIADAVLCFAYRRGLATLWPEPENSMHYIQSKVYDLGYNKVLPDTYCMYEPQIGTDESFDYYKERV
ncbi:NADP-dependent malic enzyme [Drosophila albomicans]|uniref:NADP-dependent malic enzyme n=1 Tax=Drosophila albomicans TaxID=7291 RepID=A0A6P8WEH0_DROAB|nr:NADP-dependent malic enzyme [Drosophila albomicans]